MSAGITTDAIMFFDDNKVGKEMFYPEFEAILDHVVGISEFKEKRVQAAYVRINSCLQITAAVFFMIDFDASGYVDKTWNIPLQHLADSAGRGPDLGAGPIKLSCRSQCSVSWHQRSLWDPDMDNDNITLRQLAQAAKSNRLGLSVVDVVPEDVMPAPAKNNAEGAAASSEAEREELKKQLKKKYQLEMKARTTALLEEQRLRIAAMKSEAQDHIESLQIHYQRELEKVTETLESTKYLFSEEKHKNLQLKQTLENHAKNSQQVRQRWLQEIEQGKELKQNQIQELEEKFALEVTAKVDAATVELKEMLNMREVELFYRDEQVGRLNAEISALRQEKQSLIDGSGDKVLQKLFDSGITFVACQPGVDHLTVPLKDMSKYLDSPVSYVAEKCSVDLNLYQQWRGHYELPVCSYKLEDGSTCAAPIPKVEKPTRFILGESDCCAKHSRSANTLSYLMKVRESN